MEEQYKDPAIVVHTPSVVRGGDQAARLSFRNGREAVERLKLELDYDTAKQAERAGLVFSRILMRDLSP